MGQIDTALARRIARLMAEREAVLGIRLEIYAIEWPEGARDPVVTFRPWRRPGVATETPDADQA